MTSNYCGNGIYEIWINEKHSILSVDEINQITAHNFKDNSTGKSKIEPEDSIEDLEYEARDERDFAIGALRDVSDKITRVQRKLDELTDEIENTDKELFKTLSEIGDELDAVNEFTLDMESSVKGQLSSL